MIEAGAALHSASSGPDTPEVRALGSGLTGGAAFDDALRAALQGTGSAVGRGSMPALDGTNDPQNRRVLDRTRGDSSRPADPSESDRHASPSAAELLGISSLVSPEAAAAAILVSPQPSHALHAPSSTTPLAERAKGEMNEAGDEPSPGAARSAPASISTAPSGPHDTDGPEDAPAEGRAFHNRESAPSTSATPASDASRSSGMADHPRTSGQVDSDAGLSGRGGAAFPAPGIASAADSSPAARAVAAVSLRTIEGPTGARGAIVVGGAINGLARSGATARTNAGQTNTPGLVRAPAPSVTDQVARGLAAALRQRSGTMTLRLSPEALGQVRIDIAVEGRSVKARVVAADDDACAALSRDADSLRASLEARGLKVDHLQVVTREQELAATRDAGGAITPDPNGSASGTPFEGQSGGGGARDGAPDRAGSPGGSPFSTPAPFDPSADSHASSIAWDGSVLRVDAIA